MDRITEKQLERSILRLNELAGTPSEPYAKVNGHHLAQIGNFHLDIAYGGYALVQMVGASGGVRTIIERSTKRDLFNQIHALIRGFELATERKKAKA